MNGRFARGTVWLARLHSPVLRWHPPRRGGGGVLVRRLAAADPRVSARVLRNTELPGHYPHRSVAAPFVERSAWTRAPAAWRIAPLRRSNQSGFGNSAVGTIARAA